MKSKLSVTIIVLGISFFVEVYPASATTPSNQNVRVDRHCNVLGNFRSLPLDESTRIISEQRKCIQEREEARQRQRQAELEVQRREESERQGGV